MSETVQIKKLDRIEDLKTLVPGNVVDVRIIYDKKTDEPIIKDNMVYVGRISKKRHFAKKTEYGDVMNFAAYDKDISILDGSVIISQSAKSYSACLYREDDGEHFKLRRRLLAEAGL